MHLNRSTKKIVGDKVYRFDIRHSERIPGHKHPVPRLVVYLASIKESELSIVEHRMFFWSKVDANLKEKGIKLKKKDLEKIEKIVPR